MSDIKNEDTGEKLLPKRFEKISFVGNEVALANHYWKDAELTFLADSKPTSIGVMQKIHQSSDYRGELTMFLIIAFIGSFIFSAGSMAVGKIRNGKSEKEPLFSAKVSFLLLTVLFCAGGIGVALNNLINLYLSGVVESAIFFPVVNGGGLILITIASLVFFREKLTKRQWIGMIFGLAAVLLLCL